MWKAALQHRVLAVPVPRGPSEVPFAQNSIRCPLGDPKTCSEAPGKGLAREEMLSGLGLDMGGPGHPGPVLVG